MSIEATWNIRLDVSCAKCGHEFNMLDLPDFWETYLFDLGEHGTDRTKNVEVVCPKCGHKFEVDLVY